MKAHSSRLAKEVMATTEGAQKLKEAPEEEPNVGVPRGSDHRLQGICQITENPREEGVGFIPIRVLNHSNPF